MSGTPGLLIGGNDAGHFSMDAAMANRHGLIAGATGTGKTITLQKLAESAEQEKNKKSTTAKKRSTRQSPMEAVVSSAARSMGSQIGRQIMRGILGSLFGRR